MGRHVALLTIAEVRAHITTALTDAALQLLMDAAEAEITGTIGPVGAVSEIITAGPGDLVMLSYPAASITSVTGYAALTASDYELVGSGRLLRRREGGTYPDSRWRGRVIVTYTPVSDLVRRKAAQLALLELDTGTDSNVTSERIGDWAQTYATSGDGTSQRALILGSLERTFLLI